MLAGLFRDAVAELVFDTLDQLLAAPSPPAHPALRQHDLTAGAASPLVLVVGDVVLGRSLVGIGRRRGAGGRLPLYTLQVAAPAKARAARKLEGVLVAELPEELPLPASSAAVLIGVGAMAAPVPSRWLTEWCRVVRPGGGLILVDRCAPTLATRHALCAGLVELEQRHSGRAVVTSGLVTADSVAAVA